VKLIIDAGGMLVQSQHTNTAANSADSLAQKGLIHVDGSPCMTHVVTARPPGKEKEGKRK
jgi:hypothetical protein